MVRIEGKTVRAVADDAAGLLQLLLEAVVTVGAQGLQLAFPEQTFIATMRLDVIGHRGYFDAAEHTPAIAAQWFEAQLLQTSPSPSLRAVERTAHEHSTTCANPKAMRVP